VRRNCACEHRGMVELAYEARNDPNLAIAGLTRC
jgi:hypothetical protein